MTWSKGVPKRGRNVDANRWKLTVKILRKSIKVPHRSVFLLNFPFQLNQREAHRWEITSLSALISDLSIQKKISATVGANIRFNHMFNSINMFLLYYNKFFRFCALTFSIAISKLSQNIKKILWDNLNNVTVMVRGRYND